MTDNTASNTAASLAKQCENLSEQLREVGLIASASTLHNLGVILKAGEYDNLIATSQVVAA